MPPRPDRPRIATASPDWRMVVTDDGSRTLECVQTRQTHHSESGALTESRHVYLENSLVGDRLRRGETTRVFETGFGVGLNFWVTAGVAIQHQTRLEYVATEQKLPPPAVIAELGFEALADCQTALEKFLPQLGQLPPEPSPACVEAEGVRLEILRGEGTRVEFPARGSFDALYHDPFSPEVNPELWTGSYLARLAGLLKPGGRLVTYCCRSEIKRRLKSAGLTVVPTHGPAGGKREVLVAIRPDPG